jgi:putative Holliday junction resolvase
MGRILALDVGERRTGIAISTPEGTLALPLRIIERSTEAADIDEIARLAQAESVEAIIVGLPVSLDGTEGPQARRMRSFAGRLKKATGLNVELWDERLSSVQAERSRTHRGRPVDDIAAAIILQGFLDRRSKAPP